MPATLTRVIRTKTKGSTEQRPGKVAATQTLKHMDIVIARDSAGRFAQAAAGNADVAAPSDTVKLAVYAGPDVTTPATDTVYPLEFLGDGNSQIMLPLVNDNAVAVWSEAYKGRRVGIRRVQTTLEYGANINETTDVFLEIVDVVEETRADAAPWVWCKCLTDGFQWAP